jgi:hypothetical protein
MIAARMTLLRRLRIPVLQSSYCSCSRISLFHRRVTFPPIQHPNRAVLRSVVSIQSSSSKAPEGTVYFWLCIATAMMMSSWNWGTTPDETIEDPMGPQPKNDSLWSRYPGRWNMNTLLSQWDSYFEWRSNLTTAHCCGIAGVVGTLKNHDARYVYR